MLNMEKGFLMQTDLSIFCLSTYTTISIDSVMEQYKPDQPVQMCRVT